MLLEAMYKIDTLDKASVDELLEVLRLAHKYDAKFVFKKCKYVLKDMVDSLEICEDIMRFIKVDNTITDVEDLVSTLQSFLAKEFSPIDKTWQTTRFKELCEHSLKYLLSSDELVTVSENTVFHALMHWIEERGIENVSESQDLPSLLSVVRFELMPIDYLYNIVQHHPVAKKLMDFTNHYLRGISYHALSDTMKQRLPRQPVKKRAETQPFVAFTWVIPTHKLNANTPGMTEKTLKSEEFWYCGYKMSLVITDIAKAENFYVNHLTFTAKLSLEIRNLTQESEVSIQWQPASNCIVSIPFEERHTFDKEGSLSSMDITYKIEVQERRNNTFGGIRAPTTQSRFNTGAASSTPSGLFSGVPATTAQSSFNIRAASTAPSGLFSSVPAITTQSGLNIRAASPPPSGLFSSVPAITTQSGLNIRSVSPAQSGLFSSVPKTTTQSSFNIRAASPAPSGIFSVSATTTHSSFNIPSASPTPSGIFSVPATKTQSSFNIRTASSTTSGRFGALASTTQSGFTLGAASGMNTSVTPFSFSKPVSSFGTWSTNKGKENKSDLMSKPESSNSSCVQIDVIMKLV